MFTDILPSNPRAITLSLNQIQEHLQRYKVCKPHGINFPVFFLVFHCYHIKTETCQALLIFLISARTFLSKTDILKLTVLNTHSVDNNYDDKTKYLAAVFPHCREGEVHYSRYFWQSNFTGWKEAKRGRHSNILDLDKFRMFCVTSTKLKRHSFTEMAAPGSYSGGCKRWAALHGGADVF